MGSDDENQQTPDVAAMLDLTSKKKSKKKKKDKAVEGSKPSSSKADKASSGGIGKFRYEAKMDRNVDMESKY